MQYLPSRKFFIVVLSITLIISSVFGYQTWRKKVIADQEKAALEKEKIIPISKANKDSDGDGLLDWEEANLGTNPYKTDTDKDGTPDGIEIADRRDPLTKGPNDYINAIGTSTIPKLSSEKDLTETEKIMRTMLTIASRDNATNKELPETISKNIITAINEKSNDIPVNYTASDIKTIPETEATLKQYGNTLGAILQKYDSQKVEQQKISYIIVMSLKTKDNSVFQIFPALIEARKEQIAAILKIKVPSELVNIHLNLLNSLSGIIISIDNTKYMINDPAKGLIGMKQYQSMSAKYNNTIIAITTHFDNSGISFSPDESAAFLYKTSMLE